MLMSLGTKAITSFFAAGVDEDEDDELVLPPLPPHPVISMSRITLNVEISANLREECIIGVISFCLVGRVLWEFNDIYRAVTTMYN